MLKTHAILQDVLIVVYCVGVCVLFHQPREYWKPFYFLGAIIMLILGDDNIVWVTWLLATY
jgi:hypothetical protein